MYRLGLVSISFRSLSRAEITELAKSAELECIEWGSDVHAPAEDENALSEIAVLQNESGIYCSSYGTYFRIGSDPVSDIYKYIKAAKILGTDTLRLWCGNKPSADYTQAEREAVTQDCIALSKIAEREGVFLCLECHINTLTDDRESAKLLMETVNSPNFCMYWQPNQFKDPGTNISYAKWAAPYTKRIHVFNWKEKEKLPLALGKDTWKKYLECFHGGTLLLEFVPDGKPQTLLTEAKTLFEIAGEIK